MCGAITFQGRHTAVAAADSAAVEKDVRNAGVEGFWKAAFSTTTDSGAVPIPFAEPAPRFLLT